MVSNISGLCFTCMLGKHSRRGDSWKHPSIEIIMLLESKTLLVNVMNIIWISLRSKS